MERELHILSKQRNASRGHCWLIQHQSLFLSLQKVFPHTFRDLTPVAAVIADYGVFAVRSDSEFRRWEDVVAAFRANPRQLRVGGGSGRRSMDGLVAALAFKAAGGDPKAVRYIPYDGGGKALAGLLSGETEILSTGWERRWSKHKAGQVRILAITADKRSTSVPNVPTLKELGYDATFVNWRGFFGPPGLSETQVSAYADLLKKMYETRRGRRCERATVGKISQTGEGILHLFGRAGKGHR